MAAQLAHSPAPPDPAHLWLHPWRAIYRLLFSCSRRCTDRWRATTPAATERRRGGSPPLPRPETSTAAGPTPCSGLGFHLLQESSHRTLPLLLPQSFQHGRG